MCRRLLCAENPRLEIENGGSEKIKAAVMGALNRSLYGGFFSFPLCGKLRRHSANY
jgi:hypothetical protein